MASFLQNNGDIILDAVLTDYGRKLLAKGDGSFNIVKFAFADDEIDYSLFDVTASSVNQDAQIMSTPILEAFTNNAASMKSKLMSMGPGVDNLLFLPVIKLNNIENSPGQTGNFGPTISDIVFSNGYVVPVDVTNVSNPKIASNALTSSKNVFMPGVLNITEKTIVVDQGLDSLETNSNQSLKDVYPALYETEYNVYVDNRFCFVGRNTNGTLTSLSPLSVDDDNEAVYKLNEQTLVNNTSYVAPLKSTDKTSIAGIKGSRVQFTVIPNGNLLFTDSLFDKYGKELVLNPAQPDKTFKTIRTSVRVEGVNTGYSVEIPVLFAKLS